MKQLNKTFAAVLLAACAPWPVQAAGVPGQGTWESTLQARDLNNDGTNDAYYDTALNVTWLRDWNAAAGSAYQDAFAAGIGLPGLMTWANAKAWAAGLEVGGVTGWRLPTLIDTGAPGCDYSNAGGTDCGYNVQTLSGGTVYSELAHMFYATLGNSGACPAGIQSCPPGPVFGTFLSNTANFTNMQSDNYWSGLGYAPAAQFAWMFDLKRGQQINIDIGSKVYGIAVHAGDIAAVPEPSHAALLLLGLATLAAKRARQVQL